MDRRKQATIFIVDDDEAMLDALRIFLKTEGLTARTYSSAQDFLAEYRPEQSGCLLLDIQMPSITGLELQQTLTDIGSILPIIFITGHGDVSIAVQAMKAGAFEFLQKPFSDKLLLSCIHEALALDVKNRSQLANKQSVLDRIDKLSPREKQVMHYVSDGKSNKVIAAGLGLSPRTVEIYRSHVMLKMDVNSAIELVKLLDACDYSTA